MPNSRASRYARLRPVADEQEARVHLLPDAIEHPHHRVNPLHRPEVRDVNDDFRVLVLADISRPQVADVLTAVDVAVEEVRNHHDVALHAELFVGGRPEAFRHRGDEVRLVDRERDNLRVRRIAADERDVRPVERRHDARRLSAMRPDDLAREEPGCGVRDGVVRVDDVEAELARHLDDLVRQREQVLRFAEQRIRRGQHLVEREPLLELAEPERRLRADEVHLVAAAGERLAELGGNDAAAANRGVADDADVHEWFLPVEGGAAWIPHSRSR